MKPGETRSVQVEFPADFWCRSCAGKKANYAVTLNEIKEQGSAGAERRVRGQSFLPEKTLEDLRHTIEHDLEHEKEHEVERAKEAQIVKFLHEQISSNCRRALLTNETRRALGELVQRNRERGVPDEMLKAKEKELIEGAGRPGGAPVEDELHSLIASPSRRRLRSRAKTSTSAFGSRRCATTFPSKKCARNLRNMIGLNALAEQILLGKTLDFLKANVSVKQR